MINASFIFGLVAMISIFTTQLFMIIGVNIIWVWYSLLGFSFLFLCLASLSVKPTPNEKPPTDYAKYYPFNKFFKHHVSEVWLLVHACRRILLISVNNLTHSKYIQRQSDNTYSHSLVHILKHILSVVKKLCQPKKNDTLNPDCLY